MTFNNPACLNDGKPCNPDGYGGCVSCDEYTTAKSLLTVEGMPAADDYVTRQIMAISDNGQSATLPPDELEHGLSILRWAAKFGSGTIHATAAASLLTEREELRKGFRFLLGAAEAMNRKLKILTDGGTSYDIDIQHAKNLVEASFDKRGN